MHPLTRLCFLLLLLGRFSLLASLFLLGTCLPSLWSLPFFFHAPALMLLFLAKVRLSLTSRSGDLDRWLSSFSFWKKAALVYLPTVYCVALRPHFPFRQAQLVQVFPLEPAPFCKLFAGLSSTNMSAISLFLSDSRSNFATLSSPPSFTFNSNTLADLAETVFSLPCYYQTTMGPQTLISPRKHS